jgi:toxin ParE1/3/4
VTRAFRYTSGALDDLRDIADFIAERSLSEDISEAFIFDLDERCRKLAVLPGQLGSDRSELRTGIRSTPHKGYIIFFRYGDELMEVVSIVHGSRDLNSHFSKDTDDGGQAV